MSKKNLNKFVSDAIRYSGAGMLLVSWGCVMIPEYEHPNSALPDYGLEAESFMYDKGLWKNAVPADELPKGNWWAVFNDDTLNKLISECDKSNPDIASAFHNVERLREAAFVSEADLYPHFGSSDYYMRDGRSIDFSPVPTGTYNSWVVGLGTTWDLDLFGRIQSIVIKDRSLLQASYNMYCNLMLSLHARIASEYFFARQCESEVRLLEETLAVRKKQTEFVQKRRDLKFASKLDLSRAKVLEYEAASQLDSVKRQLDIAKNRIALLCGKSPSNFDLSCSPLSDDLPKIPKVFPSQLLERRPDIAAAEREVFAANAQLGADTAAFFPTVSITGDVGFKANKIDNLLQASSLAWGISPQVYIPIFQAGKLYAQKQADLEAHKAATEKYKSTVLKAIEEVETSLLNISNMEREYENRKQTSIHSANVQSYTQKQYELGLEDYFAVSDAQRQYLLYKREEIRLLGARFRAHVSLIMSLGGGWKSDVENPKAFELIN